MYMFFQYIGILEIVFFLANFVELKCGMQNDVKKTSNQEIQSLVFIVCKEKYNYHSYEILHMDFSN